MVIMIFIIRTIARSDAARVTCSTWYGFSRDLQYLIRILTWLVVLIRILAWLVVKIRRKCPHYIFSQAAELWVRGRVRTRLVLSLHYSFYVCKSHGQHIVCDLAIDLLMLVFLTGTAVSLTAEQVCLKRASEVTPSEPICITTVSLG